MQAVMVGSERPGVAGDRPGQRGVFISCCAQKAGAVFPRCELFGVPSAASVHIPCQEFGDVQNPLHLKRSGCS